MNSGRIYHDEVEEFFALSDNTTSIPTLEEDNVEKLPDNPLLEQVLDFYQCRDLLPLARRIIWLSSVKEVMGYIPEYIPIDYDELQYLVILNDEQGKKLAYENYKMKKDSEQRQKELDLQSLAEQR